jgi:hypothetical protein
MEQQRPMPRMGAEYGGRMGFQQGLGTSLHGDDESALMKKVQFLMEVLGLSQEEALQRATSQFRKPLSPERPELEPGSFAIDKYQAPLRQMPMPMGRTGLPGRRQIEDIREPQELGIETLRGRR